MSPGTAGVLIHIRAAVAALAGIPHACIELGLSSEVQSTELCAALNGAPYGHCTIYPDIVQLGACWLYGFRAEIDGVTIRGSGDRPATEAEMASARVCRLTPETTPEDRAKALAELSARRAA